jgi:RHS repeat-associated protein
MGRVWRHSHFAQLKQRDNNRLDIDIPGGGQRVFVRDTYPVQGPWRLLNGFDTLTQTANGWQLRMLADDSVLAFGATGILQSVTHRNGWVLTYNHDASGRLTQVHNQFGRALVFGYNGNGQLTSVTTPGGTIGYAYDASGRLQTVNYADGSHRSFHYEDTSNDQLLTGISVQGVRYATVGYDAQGYATSTALAGNAERYIVSYNGMAPGSRANVTDPSGNTRTYVYSAVSGMLAVTFGSSPSPTGLPDASSRVQNGFGLIDSETDFLGFNTNYTWDTTRRLPLTTTEALGQPESRTTSTTWHPQWRLPVTVTEPGRTTSYTYDGSGNPLTQTITDTGAVGTTRTTTWTYHPSGLVASETAPNGAATGYTYDSLGNLTQSTNALGHVDAYTHDGAGRVLTHTAPNGLVTSYTYDARGRMLTSNRGGEVTTLTYHPSGTMATATLPQGHVITYTYDAALRLTGWSDNRGNSGTYTLDNMGNRVNEAVRNGQNQVVWQVARTINELNRVANVSLGSQTMGYYYDGNGEPSIATNGLGQNTRQTLDPLRRVKTLTNAENATASLTYNALDGITSVTDPKSVTTAYTRDALGNATTETSPDSGSTSTQYGALGLPSSITNALGQATTITRDLLGRPTSITHSGGTTTLRYDQTPASKGYLAEIEDTSGLTTYQRDLQGRITSQTQKLINNDTRTLAYSYSATTGLLSTTTYPGGQTLQNVYDATGQLTGLTWAGQPLVSGITWSPLGQPTAWTWNLPGGATAIPATRTYNTAGQLTATEFSSYTYDAAGRITSLTQSLMQPASTDPQANTTTQAPATWTVTYSPAGRITGFTRTAAGGAPADATSYTYDANGNRSASTQQRAGTTTSRTYTLTANRQTGFSQTQTGAGSANTSVTYSYNAAGDLLSDGLRSYQYDSEERLEKVTTGTGVDAPSTQYAHNALGQRVFKTEPLFAAGSGGGSNSTTSGKNLNNLLADPEDQETEQANQDKGIIQTVYEYFTRLWSPGTSDAQKLGFTYVYGNDGTLLGEYGMGGSNSSGTTQYLYLPTANGPMPIAAIVNGVAYAVHSDHLNTPRKLTQPDGQVAWQWAYSAFGDEQPTVGAQRFTNETTNPTTGSTPIPEVTFNLRYPGQYYDKESNLHYNYFRSYSAERGRYTQADPIGLEGGFNRFGYANDAPTMFVDPFGLLVEICERPIDIDWLPRSVSSNAPRHRWIKTGSAEVGMGANCAVPGQGCSDMPLDRTYTKDHGGQSTAPGASCRPVPDVDEKCVNDALKLGRYLGRWSPFNQCQSFSNEVLEGCMTNGMNRPYIGYPKP